MIQPIYKLLDNVSRYTLFFFLILFTAPLGADDVISGSTDDERRRTSTHSVSVASTTFVVASRTVNSPVGDIALPGSTSNHENNASPTRKIDDHSRLGSVCSVASMDHQAIQAFWIQQNSNEHARAELDRCGGVVSRWGEKESQANGTQWIGTAISETGPPSSPEKIYSFLTGYDNDSPLPQVAEIKIPGLSPEKVYFEIHRKTASVRTPTGPPAGFINYCAIQNRPNGSAFNPSFATANSPSSTQIFFCSTRVLLQGAYMRLNT